MPTATHKQRLLNRIATGLRRDLEVVEPETRPVFEQLVYAVLREGTSRATADRAYQALQTQFFDWNEIRVSSVREVEEVLAAAGVPDAEARAGRVITVLQEVFESTFSFDLESLHKKGLKQAQKQLERYQGATPFAVAYTVQRGLGGHAIPVDEDMLRTLRRLELLDGAPDLATAQASLEHLVPKARGPLFAETLSALAQTYCHEDAPRCAECPVNDACPTGQASTRQLQGATRAARAKPR
jgi:endonuclease-3